MTHRNFGIHSSRFAPLVLPGVGTKAPAVTPPSPAAGARIQTVPASPKGAIWRSPARPSAVTRADLYSFPALPRGSLQSTDAPLERLNLSETVKDIAALAFTFLFLGSVGIGFAVSMFLLFFCDLH